MRFWICADVHLVILLCMCKFEALIRASRFCQQMTGRKSVRSNLKSRAVFVSTFWPQACDSVVRLDIHVIPRDSCKFQRKAYIGSSQFLKTMVAILALWKTNLCSNYIGQRSESRVIDSWRDASRRTSTTESCRGSSHSLNKERQLTPQLIMNSLRIARSALRVRSAALKAPLQRRGYAEAVSDKVCISKSGSFYSQLIWRTDQIELEPATSGTYNWLRQSLDRLL